VSQKIAPTPFRAAVRGVRRTGYADVQARQYGR
jgi:hypothetical protein